MSRGGDRALEPFWLYNVLEHDERARCPPARFGRQRLCGHLSRRRPVILERADGDSDMSDSDLTTLLPDWAGTARPGMLRDRV